MLLNLNRIFTEPDPCCTVSQSNLPPRGRTSGRHELAAVLHQWCIPEGWLPYRFVGALLPETPSNVTVSYLTISTYGPAVPGANTTSHNDGG
jgi:hypothetical protein